MGTAATAVTSTAAMLGQCWGGCADGEYEDREYEDLEYEDQGERSDSCQKSFQQGGCSHCGSLHRASFEDALEHPSDIAEHWRAAREGKPAFNDHTPDYFIWSRNPFGELPGESSDLARLDTTKKNL
jgi:hypothetical protein